MFLRHHPRKKPVKRDPPAVSVSGGRSRSGRESSCGLYVNASATDEANLSGGRVSLLYDPDRDVCAIGDGEDYLLQRRSGGSAVAATSFCREYGLEAGDRYEAWTEEGMLVFGPVSLPMRDLRERRPERRKS